MVSYNFPPYPYLQQVLKNCPHAGTLYLQLWSDKNVNNIVRVHKKQVLTKFLIPNAIFRDRIMRLVQEGVVSVEENSKKEYIIEVTDFDFDCDQTVLC